MVLRVNFQFQRFYFVVENSYTLIFFFFSLFSR
uniref:Uncharacterized protein n=1 Tax=Rhizophora mucronata TaxID=61149 RepID=A0A2P2K3X4_RHIMU